VGEVSGKFVTGQPSKEEHFHKIKRLAKQQKQGAPRFGVGFGKLGGRSEKSTGVGLWRHSGAPKFQARWPSKQRSLELRLALGRKTNGLTEGKLLRRFGFSPAASARGAGTAIFKSFAFDPMFPTHRVGTGRMAHIFEGPFGNPLPPGSKLSAQPRAPGGGNRTFAGFSGYCPGTPAFASEGTTQAGAGPLRKRKVGLTVAKAKRARRGTGPAEDNKNNSNAWASRKDLGGRADFGGFMAKTKPGWH